jgi:hypothetical protein
MGSSLKNNLQVTYLLQECQMGLKTQDWLSSEAEGEQQGNMILL